MDYHMQFMDFHSLLQKRRLLYVIFEISIPSPKTWTIICNFWNFFPFSEKHGLSYAISTKISSFSKNVDYHMQFIEFLSLFEKMVYHMQFLKFISLLQIRGLSYAVFTTSFLSPNNVDYHMQFMKFLFLLQKYGLLNVISGIFFLH